MALGDAEATDFWTGVFRSLRDRGLKVATDVDPLGWPSSPVTRTPV